MLEDLERSSRLRGPRPAPEHASTAGPSTCSTAHRLRPLRLVLLAIGAAALALGLWSGLALIGVTLPGGSPAIAGRHGALMICGFFGTVISLERAVALGRRWAYLAPALSAAGAILLVVPGTEPRAIVAFVAASAVLVVASGVIFLRQPGFFAVGLIIAALAWGIGTLTWLAGRPMPEVIGWWLAFLVLTIAAERLELSRITLPPPAAQAALALAAGLVLLGATRGELSGNAAPLMGFGFAACAGWLLIYDVARRTIRQPGQVGFSAACMLAGYGWLGVAGLLLLLAFGTAAFAYDAAVHAVTIGFVLSMVLGHAPIILPAVTGVRISYSAYAYGALAFLQLSILLRVSADFLRWHEARAWSGLLTVFALASFAFTVVGGSIRRPGPRH